MEVSVKRNLIHAGFTLLLSTMLCLFSIKAQAPPSSSAGQFQTLEGLADQVKGALQRGDLETANRLSSDLMLGIFKQKKALAPTPQQTLATLEQALPPTGSARFYALPLLAKAAFDAAEFNKAEAYASELLSIAPGYRKNWNYGNAIFYGNMVMGRVALRRDRDMELAKNRLLASAKTPGSPQLNSFGPNMNLALDLLNLGERDSPLAFFGLCRTFWKSPSHKLDDWTAMVKGGGTPDFGANLLY
jgi:hypothetical protein